MAALKHNFFLFLWAGLILLLALILIGAAFPQVPLYGLPEVLKPDFRSPGFSPEISVPVLCGEERLERKLDAMFFSYRAVSTSA